MNIHPQNLVGYDLLLGAEICLGDLLVPVGTKPNTADWALVAPDDTYLIGHRTTAEGLSPARLFRVYRAKSAETPPAEAPATQPEKPISIQYHYAQPNGHYLRVTKYADGTRAVEISEGGEAVRLGLSAEVYSALMKGLSIVT